MRKSPQRIVRHIYRKFKFFWVIATIFLLLLALFINWHLSVKHSYREIQAVAAKQSNDVDGLIEDLFQDIYTLPIYGSKIPDCKKGLFPYLRHITANNTEISGLVISDKNRKLICSTLPANESLISKSSQPRIIAGPFKIMLFEQPVYLVQQKMGQYYIGIIIFSSVIESVLRPNAKIAHSISLYNDYEHKNIIRLVLSSNKSVWRFSKDLESQTPANTEDNFYSEPLQSIDDVDVVVYEDNQAKMFNLWSSQLILALLFLLGSWLAYRFTKRKLIQHYSLNNALKSALKNEEFYPVYQPLYDVELKTYSGVEMLLRWEDQRGKVIMPDTFINEAESSGLIVPITLQIIEMAFQEFDTILKTRDYFHLGFNLSAAHFTSAYFFNDFYALIEKYKINPQQVLLEMTERDLIDKNDSLFNERMQELRKKEYSLAIDDYGTGHASISYLQHFPFNYLKIDKLFVQAIGTKAITESLNEAIIQMAKTLDLLIIAEGVETEEQVSYLSKNGVRLLQGWYFSKALPIEELEALLQENNYDSRS